ncbi:SGNH/GDSL hydrolase family protein [Psychromicrobium lacuslunae]|uniref:Hydrolase GDSL n=1 Tax=Psychromicrobium lacuslunae TaxID=1618207 RepID=A0A0D4C237_9MICC|nr:SGNH/GDSL hydrolase family protein [Psychromicrobium lacuslunae]AJT42436.1 hydrolase GDSL [Psychromicrobium lacuslunae]
MNPADDFFAESSDSEVLPLSTAVELLRGSDWRRFAVFGDSLSLGVGDATPGYRELGWPDRLARVLWELDPEMRYLNTAQIGATTTQALQTQRQQIDSFRPDLLHLNSGANDIMRRQLDWDDIESKLRAMWQWAARTGAQLSVFTLGRAFVIPKIEDWTSRITRLNELTRNLATEFNAALGEAWDHPLNNRAELLSQDRIHFSTSGQAVLASLIVQALADRLNQPSVPKGLSIR